MTRWRDYFKVLTEDKQETEEEYIQGVETDDSKINSSGMKNHINVEYMTTGVKEEFKDILQ